MENESESKPKKRTMTPETLEKLKLAREKALEKKKQMKELTLKEKELKQKEFEKRIEKVKQKEVELQGDGLIDERRGSPPKESESESEVSEIIEVVRRRNTDKPKKKVKKIVKKVIEVSSSESESEEEDYKTSIKNKYKQKYKAKYGVVQPYDEERGVSARRHNPIKETARDSIIHKANEELRRLAYSSVFPDY